jgi:hypothetical protein
MKIVLVWIMMVGVFTTAHSQNIIYDENAEVRQVGRFTGIEVSGTISLYLSQGDETGVAISAGDEKYNSKIKTDVVNGVLKISVDGGIWNSFSLSNKKLKAYVSVVEINRLDISGASFATINGVLKSGTFQVSLSGASELKGNFQVDKLNLGIAGASVARLAGSAKNASIEASGASRVLAYDLSLQTLKVNASGASQVRANVAEELIANASGGSTIYYKGTATKSSLNASGGANIKKASGIGN